MGFLQRILAGGIPLDCVRESFTHIHAWLTEKKLDSAEAELLADMTRKVDWSDHVEKEDFGRLMDYFSTRSSISEDLSYAEVVLLDWT